MRVHKLTFAALAVAASLSLTACQNDEDATGQSDPSAASSEASSGDSQQGAGDESAGEGTGGQGTAAGTGSDSSSGSGETDKVGKCRTDELKFKAMDATIDGDTDGTVAVELTNGGGRECAISGYAGVDLKTNSGTLSAKRSGEPVVPGTLKDGETVAFGIHYPINDSGGSGVRITGLVVTPPDETKSVTLDWPGAATLPVTDGTGSPVKVGPIGSAGQGG
ncbi:MULTISPECIES: DUF4232 domain-containing protein [unclassified Streptomyces]|uniref:DUF4232 domain-containing protein n=1 Tax=unclassified Streptomyces TaxID=2593676 RepID=UPI0035E18829